MTATELIPYPYATVNLNPSDPTSTTKSTYVMMGLGSTCSFTPTRSGILLVTFDGDIASTTYTTYGYMYLAYGTGAAPANGADATGTTLGNYIYDIITGTTEAWYCFHITRLVKGLTKGTKYWFDAQLEVSPAASTAQIRQLTMTITELLY